MNQATEAFLIQLRDLCRSHGVDFRADFGYVDFNSTDNSTAPIQSVAASLEGLGDLEYKLERAREIRIRRAAWAARGKPDPTP